MSNKNRCLLADFCRFVGSSRCTDTCPPYIGLHGKSGRGGRIGSAGIPEAYRNLTLETSPVRVSQKEIYRQLREYIRTFKVEKPPLSLYLFSREPGTGKTTTACVLLNEWIRRQYVLSVKNGRQPLQVPGYFMDVNEWQSLYNKATREGVPMEMRESAYAEYYHRMNQAKTASFVVLDDIGVRGATEAFRSDLHDIINYRVTRQLTTIFTSNIPIEELKSVYDLRLYDRIRDMTLVVPFGGKSKRGLRI